METDEMDLGDDKSLKWKVCKVINSLCFHAVAWGVVIQEEGVSWSKKKNTLFSDLLNEYK